MPKRPPNVATRVVFRLTSVRRPLQSGRSDKSLGRRRLSETQAFSGADAPGEGSARSGLVVLVGAHRSVSSPAPQQGQRNWTTSGVFAIPSGAFAKVSDVPMKLPTRGKHAKMLADRILG